MRTWKKYVYYAILGISVVALAAGCKKKQKETESITEEMTETDSSVEEKVGTTVVTTKEYTARDKSFSITLPDSTWKNTKDTDDTLVFESTTGTITITHLTGTSAESVTLPQSEEEVLENFQTAGKDSSYYEVTEFKKTTSGTKDSYHTVIKCSDPEESYVYSIGYDIADTSELYSVTGLVNEDNEEDLKEIKEAVESFKILTKTTTSDTETSESSDTTTSGSGSQAGDTKVIYDSNGNAIYVTLGSNGVWSDGNGKTYDMQQYGVMGSDGYWYTYSSSTGSSSTGGSTGTDSTGGSTGGSTGTDGTGGSTGGSTGSSTETSGFYDQNGNYISVYKDANGNWVDSYGTVYYFGNDGVTDNAGNSYPYKDSSETSGFYDSNGNYITVTKDSNGNWVDGNGGTYTFGETGVTDSAGNFYPY